MMNKDLYNAQFAMWTIGHSAAVMDIGLVICQRRQGSLSASWFFHLLGNYLYLIHNTKFIRRRSSEAKPEIVYFA